MAAASSSARPISEKSETFFTIATYLSRFCGIAAVAARSFASRAARSSAVSGGGGGGVDRSHVGLGLM